ncbi:MAG: GDSL-type esterase/lipase family protein [Microbacterium sp.]
MAASRIARRSAAMLRRLGSPDTIELPGVAPDDRRSAADGLARVVERVRERAPGAHIMLVDDLPIIGAASTHFDGADELRQRQATLAAAFASAADRTGAPHVAASQLTGHETGTADPWVFGVIDDPQLFGASLHPNASGSTAVALTVFDALRSPR